MRSRMFPLLLLVLGGCVDVSSEWETPAGDAWAPASRCDGGDAEDEDVEDRDAEDEDEAENGARRSDDVDAAEADSCGVGEAFSCGDGLTACESEGGWFCADLDEHDEHCGECFNDCTAYGDAMCQDGECYCRGGPWMQLCGEGCADTRQDPTGCGVECTDCRVEFGPDARCEQGICAPPLSG